MIAWNRVAQLRDELGEVDFGEVVGLFLEEVDQVMDRLNTDKSQEALGSDFHFLKGSALNLGFQGFASVCQEGENATKENRATQDTVARVRNTYNDSRQAFLAELEARIRPTQ